MTLLRRALTVICLGLVPITLSVSPARGEEEGRRPRPPVRVNPRRGPAGKPRLPIARSIQRSHPTTPEERAFVRTFTEDFAETLTLVAAKPALRFPAGSLAERIRRTCAAIKNSPGNRMQVNATRLRQDDGQALQERLRVRMGPAQRLARVQRTPGLAPDLKFLLRKAVRARLKNLKPRSGSTGITAPRVTRTRAVKTWLEAGVFWADGEKLYGQKVALFQPEPLQFRWRTEQKGAEQGAWELRQRLRTAVRSGRSGLTPDRARGTREGAKPQRPRTRMIARGIAGPAPGGVFKVDMQRYVPRVAPTMPIFYELVVRPQTKLRMQRTRVGSSGSGRPGFTPPKPVGPESAPVVITYVKKGTQKGPSFTPNFVYRMAKLEVLKLVQVADSNEVGMEEFALTGAVKEIPYTGVGKSYRLRPYYLNLGPETGDSAEIGYSCNFHLNNPTTNAWPRSYAAIFTLLEEDCECDLQEWIESFWTSIDEFLKSDIVQEIREFFAEHPELVSDTTAAVSAWIASVISAEVATVVGMVVAAITYVVIIVAISMEDDYYGTEHFTFTLPTNLADCTPENPDLCVHSMPGVQRSDRTFRFGVERIRFRGRASAIEAARYDGKVDIHVRWSLWGKQSWP